MVLPFNKIPPAPGLPFPAPGLVHRGLVSPKTGLSCRGQSPNIQGCHRHTVWSWAAHLPSSTSVAPAARSRAQKGLKGSLSEVKEPQNNQCLQAAKIKSLSSSHSCNQYPSSGGSRETHTINTNEARAKSHRDDGMMLWGFPQTLFLSHPHSCTSASSLLLTAHCSSTGSCP